MSLLTHTFLLMILCALYGYSTSSTISLSHLKITSSDNTQNIYISEGYGFFSIEKRKKYPYHINITLTSYSSLNLPSDDLLEITFPESNTYANLSFIAAQLGDCTAEISTLSVNAQKMTFTLNSKSGQSESLSFSLTLYASYTTATQFRDNLATECQSRLSAIRLGMDELDKTLEAKEAEYFIDENTIKLEKLIEMDQRKSKFSKENYDGSAAAFFFKMTFGEKIMYLLELINDP